MKKVPEVKKLTILDAESAAKIHIETWRDTYPGLLPQRMIDSMTLERNIPMWKEIIEKDSYHNFGAFSGNELLGMGTAGKPRLDLGFDAEIWSMNVPKRNQGIGAGKRIFEVLLQELRLGGAKKIYLTCVDKNFNALAFYQHMGGKQASDLLLRDGYQELLFSWDI